MNDESAMGDPKHEAECQNTEDSIFCISYCFRNHPGIFPQRKNSVSVIKSGPDGFHEYFKGREKDRGAGFYAKGPDGRDDSAKRLSGKGRFAQFLDHVVKLVSEGVTFFKKFAPTFFE